MKTKLRLCLVVLATVLLVAFEVAAVVPVYTVTDLGLLNPTDNSSTAFDINERRQVVGGSGTQGFLWEDGVMTGLGVLPGFTSAFSAGINNHGEVTGDLRNFNAPPGTPSRRAFLWVDGIMTDLGTLGGLESSAFDINDHGQVVGWANTTSGTAHAFIWQDGQMTDIGTPGSYPISEAIAINDRAQVIGDSGLASFLWESGRFINLGNVTALDINDRGQVVGVMTVVPFEDHAFIWQDGVITDLGFPSGFISSRANGINKHGQVVGSIVDADRNLHAAILLNGVMSDLNVLIPADSGWYLSTAEAINDRGEIVGEGTHNGQVRAFLLTPM